MRAWDRIVGWVVGVVGSAVWAVSLAIYQQRIEPSGYWLGPDGEPLYPKLASNDTYWPREVRELAILLAVAGVIAVGRASDRALIAAGTLGVTWFAADLVLDHIDINGTAAMASLAVAGCVAVVAAGVAARRGEPTEWGGYLTAGTALVLAVVPIYINSPWRGAFALSVGLLAVAVALLRPTMTTVRSRWLVPVGALLLGLGVVAEIADQPPVSLPIEPFFPLILVLIPLALVTLAASRDAPFGRVALVGGTTVLLLPCMLGVLLFFGRMGGRLLTELAGNPAVNGADFDIALVPTMALCGLALTGTSLAITNARHLRRRRSAEEVYGRAIVRCPTCGGSSVVQGPPTLNRPGGTLVPRQDPCPNPACVAGYVPAQEAREAGAAPELVGGSSR